MANRVTAADVEKIIEVESSIDTEVFIDTANALLTEMETGLGETILTEIELYLSAHFVSMRQRQLTEEKFGDATQKYGGKFGMGLEFSQYGQQALLLDVSGRLRNLGKQKMSFLAL